MRATIEYDLDKEEDRTEFKHAIKAMDYAAALFALDQALRTQVKYVDDDVASVFIEGVEWARDKMWEILGDYNAVGTITDIE